ncbi:hypothetical protein [Campylobacter sp.]|uniref:hypothetical protein n=1 Tax=Campylobacter sp. TaxID=205 RepID=UPI002A8310D5|nr:hypothetical protein [Campylobacter sp.]MDY4803093.1 hypothetical protein [Campylobacter sp.]
MAWCICGVFCEHLCVVCDKDKLFNEAYVLFCLAVLLDIVLLVIIYKLNKVCVITKFVSSPNLTGGSL